MADTITIHTDAGALSLPAGSTLADALARLERTHAAQADSTSVATAVNGDFVARGLRASHVLADGDTVLCFQAITGG